MVTGEHENFSTNDERLFRLPNGDLLEVAEDCIDSYEEPVPPAEPVAGSVVRVEDRFVFERMGVRLEVTPFRWLQVGDGSRAASWSEIIQLAARKDKKIEVLYVPGSEDDF